MVSGSSALPEPTMKQWKNITGTVIQSILPFYHKAIYTIANNGDDEDNNVIMIMMVMLIILLAMIMIKNDDNVID